MEWKDNFDGTYGNMVFPKSERLLGRIGHDTQSNPGGALPAERPTLGRPAYRGPKEEIVPRRDLQAKGALDRVSGRAVDTGARVTYFGLL